jgi:hypothetical protein
MMPSCLSSGQFPSLCAKYKGCLVAHVYVCVWERERERERENIIFTREMKQEVWNITINTLAIRKGASTQNMKPGNKLRVKWIC